MARSEEIEPNPRNGAARRLLLGCVLLVLAALGAAAYRVVFGGPYVNITDRGAEKVVDLHFLGEYCIGISHIRLAEKPANAVTWEVAAVENNDTGICRFELRLGSNSTRVGQPSDLDFKVLQPHQSTFNLQKGRTYELTAWGNNGFARWGVTRRTIRF